MLEEIFFAQQGPLGVITLNRPSALNALSLSMIMAMQQQLECWQAQDDIKAVVITAVPGNAFCAGGDVRWIYQIRQDKRQAEFFWHEYRLNGYIHQYKKPYIALMDGITMGGGVGISLHGSHSVASERFVFAMPETSIGFFPDIGSSYLLGRCPDSLGIYLGMTGNRLGADDALKAGLITHRLHSEKFADLLTALRETDLSSQAFERVSACIASFSSPAFHPDASQLHALISPCFSQPDVESIKEALLRCDEDWTATVNNTLEQKAPLSLKVTLAQLQRTKGLPLADCLRMDYNLVRHFMSQNDFYEGIRALLIDKDKKPHWNPASLHAVNESMVDAYFTAIEPELELVGTEA